MAGLETVIGTHNFDAENADEISFSIGETIVVLEKDEDYQDGWWQGRNARGEIGLFPMNYTTPSKRPSDTLHSLESKIDTLETAVSQMHLPTTKGKSVLPTPSASNSSSRQSIQPAPLTSSSASSTGSLQPYSTPASYQKKLSSKYVHQSVFTSLQNPELQANLPEDWSVEQVGIWLGLMGFSDIASTFQDQEITGDILLELNVDSLKELNVTTFGKRFKIYNAIKVLADENITRKEAPESDNNQWPAQSIVSHQPTNPPYVDDDLVSDYSSVIRNSTTAEQLKAPLSVSTSPSLTPSDHRVFSLDSHRPPAATISPSPSARHATPLNRVLSIQQQQQPSDKMMPQMTKMTLGHSITANNQLGATQQQEPRVHPGINDHHHHHHHPSPSISSELTSNLGRSSTLPSSASYQNNSTHTMNPPNGRTKYNFVRNSFLSSAKPQTALPVASRASMDGIAQRLGRENALPDMEGWLHKQGDKYKTWNKRWFVLKGSNLFYFKSPKDIRMKGIINLRGYRIVQDETIYTGKFCFKAQHERERTFYFYADTENGMKAWVKTLMKATITRDFSAPVMSSSTIPTVSLDAARRMKPRPPSMIYGKDTDSERPISPSLYDSRPFSLTYRDQAEPIMRMSMSDETRDMFPLNNQTQESGLIRNEPSPPSITSSMESRSVNNDSGFTSNTYKQSQRPYQQQQQQQQQQRKHTSAAVNMFYNEEDEDLIDPHQRPTQSNNSQTPSHISMDIERPLASRYNASESYSDHHNSNNKSDNNDNSRHSPVILSDLHLHSPSSSPPRQPIQTQSMHDRIDEQEVEGGKEHHDRTHLTADEPVPSWHWDQSDYVDWMNRHMDQRKISHVTELRTGEALVELLESISGKEVRRPSTTARVGNNPLTSMQMLDNIVAAFKFMGREGVVVDGRYNIKDIFSGNEPMIMEMLRTIKTWADQLNPSTEKMASGGTFGEEEQGKLKALDEA